MTAFGFSLVSLENHPLGSWASLVTQIVKSLPAMQETQVPSWIGKIPWRRECLPTPVYACLESSMNTGAYSSWGCKEPDMTEQLT